MNKEKILKPVLFILTGIAISLLLLGLYSRLVIPRIDSDGETLPPMNLSEKDVFITAITGEVFIIRNDVLYNA